MRAARGHLPAYASATSAAPGDHLYHLLPVQLGILGSGTYGLVVRARDTSDPDAQDVAIKLLPRGGFVSRGIAVGLVPGWGGAWGCRQWVWEGRMCSMHLVCLALLASRQP